MLMGSRRAWQRAGHGRATVCAAGGACPSPHPRLNPRHPRNHPTHRPRSDMGTVVMGKSEAGVVRKGDTLMVMPNK